jgi:hypothetical protein
MWSHTASEKKLFRYCTAVILSQDCSCTDLDEAMSRVQALAWEKPRDRKNDAKICFQEEIIDKTLHLKASSRVYTLYCYP